MDAVNTRKLYKFECESFITPKSLPMKKLRSIANKIWQIEGIKRPLPKIVAGAGCKYNGRYFSYYEKLKDGEIIVLARHQRDEITLCHELTHALGHDDHDAKFVKKLLVLFGHLGYTKESLKEAAKDYKLAGF